ncbi:MAG: sigma-54-dependent Fis family transcriptional regulator, partial [Desulfobacterales bacterium]|nr:sigma-54-dependent Fis family transcriptional regulator [Desulfobacterales bacterium]
IERHPPCHIRGDSGVGKKLMVDYIAELGGLKLVTVNCGNLGGDLFAAKLFGHKKGAYTGANRDENGFVQELGKSGVLFLDEIANLPLQVQAAFLNFLPTGNYRRVGDSTDRKVDPFTVVTATNRDLDAMVDEGLFLPDMLYRLRDLIIVIPALYERPEDIPPLVDFYLGKAIGRTGKYVRASEI